MKLSGLLAFLILLSGFQSAENNLIYWNQAKKLTWADFKGKYDSTSGLDAFTDYELAFVPLNNNISDTLLILNVTCAFNKSKSSATAGFKRAILLTHEQGHFDMAEIYTRLLRKKMLEAKVTLKNMGVLLPDIYNTNFTALRAEQAVYDKETDHSRNEERQNEWTKKIADRLKELDKYSKPVVRIKLES